jgi:hypothetical protein
MVRSRRVASKRGSRKRGSRKKSPKRKRYRAATEALSQVAHVVAHQAARRDALENNCEFIMLESIEINGYDDGFSLILVTPGEGNLEALQREIAFIRRNSPFDNVYSHDGMQDVVRIATNTMSTATLEQLKAVMNAMAEWYRVDKDVYPVSRYSRTWFDVYLQSYCVMARNHINHRQSDVLATLRRTSTRVRAAYEPGEPPE